MVDIKIKDKEALFNAAYLKKINISSVELLLRHNNVFLTDTYLPYSIFLAQPLLCKPYQLGPNNFGPEASARELLVPDLGSLVGDVFLSFVTFPSEPVYVYWIRASTYGVSLAIDS